VTVANTKRNGTLLLTSIYQWDMISAQGLRLNERLKLGFLTVPSIDDAKARTVIRWKDIIWRKLCSALDAKWYVL
jgi:hypothetical protein